MIIRATINLRDKLLEVEFTTKTVEAHAELTEYARLINEKFQKACREIENEINSRKFTEEYHVGIGTVREALDARLEQNRKDFDIAMRNISSAKKEDKQ